MLAQSETYLYRLNRLLPGLQLILQGVLVLLCCPSPLHDPTYPIF